MGPPSGTEPSLNRGDLQTLAIRGATWTMIHTLVSLPLAFLVNLVVARVLGVDDYGRLSFLTQLMTIVGSVMALGLASAVMQFGSKANATNRRADVRHLLSASQGFRLLIQAPVLSVVVIVVSDVDLAIKVIAVVFGVLVPAALDGAPLSLGIENKTAAGAKMAMIGNVLTQAAVLAAALTIGTADSICPSGSPWAGYSLRSP